MKQHARPIVASVALVIVFSLLVPGSLAGQFTPDRFPPNLPPPVSVEASPSTPAYPGCGGQFAPVVNAAYEQEIVDRVNTIRANNSLPPLKRVDPLDEAARYHATDMGQDDYFQHDSYDRVGGSLTVVCAWTERITTYYPGWSALAENIAAGYPTPADAMNGWMNSDGHRANILSTNNWEIGAGYYAGGGEYYHYWVQDFGRRSGIYPLVIDGDAAVTGSRDVTLYIYGGWDEMRLRNDDGAWSAWMPFQATSSWMLPAERGEHTVSAELRAGIETATTEDSIYLDVEGAAHYVYVPLVVH